MVKTITDVMTRGEKARGDKIRGDKTGQIVTQTGTTAGERIRVSVAIVVTGGTVTTETVITGITTGSSYVSLLDTKTE